jgi:putative addiction module component (TIGR02574 family)
MAITIEELGLHRLSREDRMALAEAIWESVAQETERSPVSESQRLELERRLTDSIARPGMTTAWETIKADAIARMRS